jgi:hypothetical protein
MFKGRLHCAFEQKSAALLRQFDPALRPACDFVERRTEFASG